MLLRLLKFKTSGASRPDKEAAFTKLKRYSNNLIGPVKEQFYKQTPEQMAAFLQNEGAVGILKFRLIPKFDLRTMGAEELRSTRNKLSQLLKLVGEFSPSQRASILKETFT